ncbi:hypothetical protein AB0C87_09290 [Actinomadura sp. NPDC048021]|uniref:hypothetical protein n=1 Tax=Actinomadura sp. NPDC048021 TaxID=3155385 RepID=UPI0033CE20E1
MFIDAFRKVFGVEPNCPVLSAHGTKIALSTYYAAKSCLASPWAIRDEWLKTEITRIYTDCYRPMELARSGGSFSARAMSWRVARWNG